MKSAVEDGATDSTVTGRLHDAARETLKLSVTESGNNRPVHPRPVHSRWDQRWTVREGCVDVSGVDAIARETIEDVERLGSDLVRTSGQIRRLHVSVDSRTCWEINLPIDALSRSCLLFVQPSRIESVDWFVWISSQLDSSRSMAMPRTEPHSKRCKELVHRSKTK